MKKMYVRYTAEFELHKGDFREGFVFTYSDNKDLDFFPASGGAYYGTVPATAINFLTNKCEKGYQLEWYRGGNENGENGICNQ